MIITISGDLGAGKSTISKMLAEKLNMPRHYAGQIWRDLAEERGVTLYELHQVGETDPSIDKEVDERTIALGKTYDEFVFDSHLAWHFIPHSFKVFLKVTPEEGARRILEDLKVNPKRYSNEHNYQTLDEAIEGLEKRKQTNKIRWKKMYGVNIHNMSNYDLVVDTTHTPPDKIIEEILKNHPT